MFGGFLFLSFFISYLTVFEYYGSATLILAIGSLALFLQRKRFFLANHRTKTNLLIGLVIGFLLGTGYGLGQSISAKKNSANFSFTQEINFKSRVLKISARSVVISFGSAKLRLTGVNLEPKSFSIKQRVKGSCQSYVSRPGIFQQLEKLQGIIAYCQVKTLEKKESKPSFLENLRSQIFAFINERLASLPDNSLGRGMLFADTSYFNDADLTTFRKMGIAHLFAASGLHLGLLFAFVYLPFLWLGRPWVGRLLGLLFCFLFLVLLDFRISLLRAFIFLLFYIILLWQDRKVHAIHILFLAAALIELFFAGSSFTLSFILSFSITAAIIIFYPFLFRLIRFKWQPLRAHLAISATTFLASSILSLVFFGYTSIFSFLFNFILVPLSSIYLVILLAFLAIPPLGPLLTFFDQIYYFFAQMYDLWLQYFPTVLYGYSLVSVLAWLLLLLLGFYLYGQKKMVLVRRYARPLPIFLLALIFFGQFYFVNYPQKAVRFFAFGSQLIEKGNYSIGGEKAPFVQSDYLGKMPELPIQKVVVANQQLKKDLRFNISQIGPIPEKQRDCFLHFSKLRVASWRNQRFAKCKTIYLAYTQKVKRQILTKKSQWLALFQQFGFGGKLVTLPYFKWHYFD